MKRPYSRRTLDALIKHIAAGGSTETYLRSHPRVSPEQIAAIFEDLRDAVDQVVIRTLAETPSDQDLIAGDSQ